jgi:alcohol dehydrogenase class IV
LSRVFRFGAGCLSELGEVAAELGFERLALVTSRRGAELAARLPVASVYAGVRSHAPVETVAEAAAAADGCDAIVGLGGGSAVDTAKAVSAQSGQPVIGVPTTYAGAEWTPFFGVRDEARRVKGGGSGARIAAALYDPELTLGLPPAETAGTAMNALAHCAEALYHPARTAASDRHAFCGARTIAYALPLVLVDGSDLYARTRLLEGAMRAAMALGDSGLCLGHAMAQALGGRYGVAHGAANAICLAPALRFNAEVAPEALETLADAMGTDDVVAKVDELARLGGFERLRDLGVPENELDEVAVAAAERGGAKANPRPASPAEIAELYRGVW